MFNTDSYFDNIASVVGDRHMVGGVSELYLDVVEHISVTTYGNDSVTSAVLTVDGVMLVIQHLQSSRIGIIYDPRRTPDSICAFLSRELLERLSLEMATEVSKHPKFNVVSSKHYNRHMLPQNRIDALRESVKETDKARNYFAADCLRLIQSLIVKDDYHVTKYDDALLAHALEMIPESSESNPGDRDALKVALNDCKAVYFDYQNQPAYQLADKLLAILNDAPVGWEIGPLSTLTEYLKAYRESTR